MVSQKYHKFYLNLFLIFFVFIYSSSFAQYNQLTPNAEISVLTIGPGSSLNDSFGHNAFRIKDNNLNIVFNYGVYDFDTPNFYTKFAQGKLNYRIDANNYEAFKSHYIGQNRTIREQVLNLTQTEKQQVFNFLAKNYEPENQYYLYDFFYDNCATKIRDVLVDALDNRVDFHEPTSFQPKSFRTLIRQNLDWNSWGSFGIDLALGSVIDVQATPTEHMFLPAYIHRFFADATLKNSSEKKLIERENIIFEKRNSKPSNNFFISPLFILGLLSAFIIYLTYLDYKKGNRTKWLDVGLFGLTGVIGIVILLLWFATDHEATAQNYNLLWAFAFNILVLGQVFKGQPKSWFIKYIKFLVIMLCLLTMHWAIGIQLFAFALIPLLLALLLRYIYLVKYFSKSGYSTTS